MSTRSRRAEASAVSQTGQELHNTSESDSPSLLGLAPQDVEHIVAKAVAAAISVLRDEFDSRLKSVEKRLATIERKFDQMNDEHKWYATYDNVQLSVDDSTIDQGTNVAGAAAGGLSFATLASDRISTLECALHSLKSELINHNIGLDAAAKDSRDSATGSASYAGLTRRLAQDPNAFRSVARKNRLIVGASSDNKRLKAVMTKRNVDVFVSRLHPETSSHELVDCVRSVGDGLKICDVTCTKLQSKYEHLYSSYHVAISVDTADMKRAVDVFMSADVWPCGVFVKRYYNR